MAVGSNGHIFSVLSSVDMFCSVVQKFFTQRGSVLWKILAKMVVHVILTII
jgi:hypothetical protein